jgi:perosamine synthetase
MIKKTRLKTEDWQKIADSIPGPEPVVKPWGNSEVFESAQRVIPVADTRLDGNELPYLTECVQSNWISSAGPFVKRFEARFAETMGCKHGVSCSSGTAALHLVMAALGLGPGDQVIMPTFTMIATPNAVSYTGASPILVDVDPDTWNLDVRQVASRINSRTRAILVVHTYGHPADMDPILDLARQHKLWVIEDAAEAHGATYKDRPVGSLGDAACFSFYANKIITTGEGGMVTTNNVELANQVRRLRDHAFSDERHFWHQYRGFNYRMTNLQAAVGLAQTERVEQLVAKRRATACRYRQLLEGVRGLTLPRETAHVRNVFWMFGLLVEPEFGCSRDELRQRLASCGIETRTFFIPVHWQPIYFEQFRGERYPVAENLCREGMYLPSGSTLSDDDIRYVADAVRKAGRHAMAA